MAERSEGPASKWPSRREALQIGIGVGAFVGLGAASAPAVADEKISSLGVYKGYSTEIYDGWMRLSQYVAVRDGVRLAADIFRPTVGSVLHMDRLPLVWIPKRYQRAVVRPDGSVASMIEPGSFYSLTIQRLVRNGYIVAAVDRRGTGSSFGVHSDYSDPVTSLDGYDMTEWFAAQPWCDGKVGMFGASYEGEMQLRVAGTAPPHLKAIMPEVAPFDWYRLAQGGGIYHGAQFLGFQRYISGQDVDPKNAPVDADEDRALLTEALAGHATGNDYSAVLGRLPYRDSVNPATGDHNWLDRHAGHYTPALSASGIAVYHRVGWFARVGFDELLWYVNQTSGPKKLLIGPWGGGLAATDYDRSMWTTEAHRFFDHWLKGVENGVMDEAPIHSSAAKSHRYGDGTTWREIRQWPLPNERRVEFFLAGGRSGSVESTNDGKLTQTAPEDQAGRDQYAVTFDCLYVGGNDPADPGEPAVDHAAFDAQGLTYTTEPLETDMEMTGHGTARLWISSTADDGDFFLKVEDVDTAGASTYVSRGTLRASRRALGTPPYDYLGLPWETCMEADVQPILKDQPTELVFALTPISYIYQRGHRIRVTITGSDLSIGESPKVTPAPVVTLHRSTSHMSSVILPIIPPV